MAPLLQPVVAPPVPTRVAITEKDPQTGVFLATPAWIKWFVNLGKNYGFNQTVLSNGTILPQELGLNFLSPLTVTDNPALGTTDIGLPTLNPLQTDVTSSRAIGTVYTADTAIAVSVQLRQSASSGGDNKIQPLVGSGSPTTKVSGTTTTSTIAGATLGAFFFVTAGYSYEVQRIALSGSSTWVVDSWVEWPI